MKINEKRLLKIAKPYLVHCRPGDWKHALRVVKWVKKLGRGRKDLDLLIAAAYLHDVGWFKVYSGKGKLRLSELLAAEKRANDNTSAVVHEILEKMGWGVKDIAAVIRLIKAADRHRSNSAGEAIIVDSDNLSKLCLAHVKEKFKQQDWFNLITMWEEEFSSRVKTPMAKKLWPGLLRKLKKSVDKHKI